MRTLIMRLNIWVSLFKRPELQTEFDFGVAVSPLFSARFSTLLMT